MTIRDGSNRISRIDRPEDRIGTGLSADMTCAQERFERARILSEWAAINGIDSMDDLESEAWSSGRAIPSPEHD